MMNTLDTNIDLRSYLSEAVKTRPRRNPEGKQYLDAEDVNTVEDLRLLLTGIGYTEYKYDEGHSGHNRNENAFKVYLNMTGGTTFEIDKSGNDYTYYIWFDITGKKKKMCGCSNSFDKIQTDEVIREITRI